MGKKSTATKNKWNAENYDRINLITPKGKKEAIKNHAEGRGETVNGFINRAIDEAIQRDCSGTVKEPGDILEYRPGTADSSSGEA